MPTKAITFSKGKARIDSAKCTECGICVEKRPLQRLPVSAIKKE